MERGILKKDDPRGNILYKEIINNKYIQKDYFEDTEKNLNLEDLFNSSNVSLEANRIKIKILYSLKNHKLSVFDYYDITESYFNKYFYNMKLMENEDNKIKEYL